MTREERVDFTARDQTRLAGTLSRPAEGAASVPAALLLSGSGPLDRDSNMRGQALNVSNAFAAALAAHGVASLRYDKRGVAESGGAYLSTGFDQETDDAVAALETLRGTPGIDGARLAIIGHSVGATIAIRLASTSHWLAGAVLIGAASRSGAEVMCWQSERIAATMRGPSLRRRRFLRRQERARRALLASTGDTLRVGTFEAPARWFREYMAFDPARDLGAIRCPVLAITGLSDIQVDPGDVARIGRALAAPFTGLTPVGLSHILRTHGGRPGLASYKAQIARPVDDDLIEQVVLWCRQRAPASSSAVR